MTAPVVIAGAGQAGVRAAETLRKLGCEEPIIMLGDERHAPYQRPPLSKKFLLGEMSEAQLFLQGEAFFAQNGIELITDCRVLSIEPHERRLHVSGGRAPLAYGKLLLATGSRARTLNLPGAEGAGVETLRSIDDVIRLREKLAGAQQVAIIGGGYIGLEVAAVLRTLDKPVIVLEAQERLLGRVVSPVVSDFFLRLHRARGVDIRLNARVARLHGDGSATVIELADGERIAADLVLAAIGGLANEELARDAGLPCRDGILVDEYGCASPDILAAGDCTRFPVARYGRHVRLESVQNASDQARAAAQAMMGQPVAYDPVPWFWSDQYDIKLQIAGLSEGYDRIAVEGDESANAFAVSYFKDDQLIAVDAVNMPRAHMQARRSLATAPQAAAAAASAG